MKLGWSPEMLRTKRVVKRICIFGFEMASNNMTTLPQRRPEAARVKERYNSVANDDGELRPG